MPNRNHGEQLQVPVAIIIFRRPKCVRKSMARIRQVRPKKLYIIADGPRASRPNEAEKCAESRRIAEGMVDWPCEVRKVYSETNMGCGKRIPSGLDEVFKEEEQAIIVEGDIVADPSFFRFCAAMLERYRDDERIMQIGGYNRFNYRPQGNAGYFYSRYSDIWGWATWRRAWRKFGENDGDAWERIKRENQLATKCASSKEADMRSFALDQIFSGELDAWGMRWELAKIMNGGLGIVPSVNLVKNIGFGFGASHTFNPLNRHRLVRLHTLNPPYRPPAGKATDKGFEDLYRSKIFTTLHTERFKTSLLKLLFRR